MEKMTSMACETSADDCTSDPQLLLHFKRALHALGGKWKLDILFALSNGAVRFGALRRAVSGVSRHMLTARLRELEQDGLISRTAFAEKPLRVEYQLTDAAYALLPAFKELLSWWQAYGRGARNARGGSNVAAASSA